MSISPNSPGLGVFTVCAERDGATLRRSWLLLSPESSFLCMVVVTGTLFSCAARTAGAFSPAEAVQPGVGGAGAGVQESPKKASPWPDNLKIPADLEEAKADQLRDLIDQFRRAEEANSSGKEMEAAASSLAAFKTKVGVPLAHYYLGLAYAHLRELPKARTELESSVALLPTFHEAEAKLALVCDRIGDAKAAEEHYQRALAIAPEYPEAVDGLIVNLLVARRFPEARKLLEHAHKVDANEARTVLLEELEDFEVGPAWESTHVAETKHFTVRTGVSMEIAAKVADAAERCYRLLMRMFPDGALTPPKCDIYLYANQAEYAISGGAMRGGGHFSPVFARLKLANTELFERLDPALKSEVAAFFFHRHLGDSFPPWLLVGVREFLEPAYLELVDDKDLWVQPPRGSPGTIVQSIRAARFIQFEELMKLNQRDLDADPVLTRAESWSLVFFCQQSGQARYKKALEGYFNLLKKGKSLDAAFQGSFGKLEAARFVNDWKSYLADELPKLTGSRR